MASYRHKTIKAYLLALMTLALLLAGAVRIVHAASYTITDLGADFKPLHINDAGVIVGIDDSGAQTVPKRYKDGILEAFGTQSQAMASNNNDLIAGYQINSPDNTAVLWQGIQLSPELSQFSGLTEANAINGFDQITGTRLVDSTYRRPFYYDITSGTLATLGTLGGSDAWGNDINGLGALTGGSFNNNGKTRAFRYLQGSGFSSISMPDGYSQSEGMAINDDYGIVGYLYNSTDIHSGKRAFYAPLDTGLVNLGAINHDTDSIARGINNEGLIIGQSVQSNGAGRAFLYDTSATDVLVVTADPNVYGTVYTGSTSGGGILKSTDSGENWEAKNRGLTERKIRHILINPTNSSIVYAATSNGVFKSTNGGDLWTSSSTGMTENLTVNSLEFDNSNSRIFAATNSGIYYSTDGGANWTLSDNTNFAFYDFTPHPVNNDMIFAASRRGVYRSTDLGVTWNQQNGFGDDKLGTRNVSVVTFDPQDDNTLYAATVGGSVYKATNLNLSLRWDQDKEGIIFQNTYNLAFDDSDPATASTVFVGSAGALYYKKTDAASWLKSVNFGDKAIYSMSMARNGDDRTLYATTGSGDILRSDNSISNVGDSWTYITRGVTTADVFAFGAVPGATTATIFAGASSGAFKLDDSGATIADWIWNGSSSGASGLKITAFAYDNRDTEITMWAGSTDQGIFKTVDSGRTWVGANTGLGNHNIYALFADISTTPATIYAGTLNGVYRSDDGGSNWVAASDGLSNTSVFSLFLDTTTSPKLLYAGTGDGIFRSSDSGNNWIPLNNGVTGISISSFVQSGGNLFAASSSIETGERGLYRWDNVNLNWERLVDSDSIYDIDAGSNTIYAATNNGIQKVSDACVAPCTLTPSYLATDTAFSALTSFSVAVNPGDPNTIYAGTASNGIYATEDAGATDWKTINSGLGTVTTNMNDLNQLIGDPLDEWELQDATSINNSGLIVGYGTYNNNLHGFLLTPGAGEGSADLVISMTSQPETIKKNVPLNYSITVTNLGPDPATNVRLVDWLPAKVMFRNAATNKGGCAKQEDNIVRCIFSTIAVNETVSASVFIEPLEADINLRNIVRVKGNEGDPDFSNNTTGTNHIISVDRCFIATAAYGSFLDPHVSELRNFRDNYLLTNSVGRYFVALYYRYSPPVAKIISADENLRLLARIGLTPVVYAVTYPLWFATGFILLIGFASYRYKTRLAR